jgi:hypothetical protein
MGRARSRRAAEPGVLAFLHYYTNASLAICISATPCICGLCCSDQVVGFLLLEARTLFGLFRRKRLASCPLFQMYFKRISKC